MADFTEAKQFKVTVNGSVIVEADNSVDAVTKATAYFVTTGKNLNWTWEELTVVKEVVTP